MSIRRFLLGALAAGAVVLGGALAGCENPAAEAPAQETETQAQEAEEARETGRITLNLGIAGEAAGEDDNGARTVMPVGNIRKCVLSFTPTRNGGRHANVEIENPVNKRVSIDYFRVGTYTITVQAYAQELGSGNLIPYSVGEKTGVEILAGENELVDIVLEPDPQGEAGYFGYGITIPAEAGGSLVITKYSGEAVEGGTISLEGGLNTGPKLFLAPGYYQARVEFAKGEKTIGFTEMVHIYPQNWSTLTWAYGAGDLPGDL